MITTSSRIHVLQVRLIFPHEINKQGKNGSPSLFFFGMLEKMTCLLVEILNLPSQKSGQIIATSHDLTPNGGLVREFPLFQENLGW